MSDFRWNEWNLDHATSHGVEPEEAEHVVRFARPPYPTHHRKGTWRVVGPGASNRRVQVIYAIDPDGTFFIIHAMPLPKGRRSGKRRK